MKDEKIIRAYEKSAPGSGTEERIWQNIFLKADAQAMSNRHTNTSRKLNTDEPPILIQARKDHPILRFFLSAAACVAVMAAVLSLGYGAYQRWGRLPSHPNEASLTQPSISSPNSEPLTPATTHAETENLAPTEGKTESFFLQRTLEILSDAGFTVLIPETESFRILEKSDSRLRDEIEVSWKSGGETISVFYDAEDGVFLGITGFDWAYSDAVTCADQAEADALATRFYESLPVEQDYKIAHCEKYDEDCWTYDFCREVEPGLYSWYECVRINLNPQTGEAKLVKIFYIPLLDEHKPEDEPLTEAAALEAAGFYPQLEQNLEKLESVTIKKAVTVPDRADSSNRSDVSRICWMIEYHKKESEDYIAGGGVKYVDYYSGEVIGYDVLK
jgi:hypothetical protein